MRHLLSLITFSLLLTLSCFGEEEKQLSQWSIPTCCCAKLHVYDPCKLHSFIKKTIKTPFSDKSFQNKPISRYSFKTIAVSASKGKELLCTHDIDYAYNQQGKIASFSYFITILVGPKLFRNTYHVKYHYDENGSLTELLYYNHPGNLILREKINFDHKTNSKISQFYSSENQLINREEQFYDKNGRLIETREYDRNGMLLWRYTYGFNKGNYFYTQYDSQNKLYRIYELPNDDCSFCLPKDVIIEYCFCNNTFLPK
ncbi:MAG: hypothetical protein IKP37_07450 [Paludibacteraceae bacterium]|nr:hypothetical protein [Paludibacteraceae bacterium]